MATKPDSPALSESSFDDESSSQPTTADIVPETVSESKPVFKLEEEEDNADDTDDELKYDEEKMFKKIANSIKKSSVSELLVEKHHELRSHNEEEIRKLTTVVRNNNGDIIDDFHKTTPIMTKYEKTRILGQRCRQLENGAIPLVDLKDYEDELLDDLFIAKMELEQRKLPFIIRRPLPNGSSEYWKVGDLEMI
jgi:DNA-directed RNA polymerase I, II, and III subunit RPABC2